MRLLAAPGDSPVVFVTQLWYTHWEGLILCFEQWSRERSLFKIFYCNITFTQNSAQSLIVEVVEFSQSEHILVISI